MIRNRAVLVVLVLSVTTCSLVRDERAFVGKMKLAQVVFRHGAKTPTRTYCNDTFTEEMWGAKWGELTQLGREQEYELGTYLRDRYDGFLPDVYNEEDVYVRSGDAERSLASASLVMRGLYRPHTASRRLVQVYWQTVPVHTAPEENDLLITTNGSPCPAFLAEKERATNCTEYQSLTRDLAKLDNFSMNAVGEGSATLFDSFSAKDYHEVPLPSWCQSMYPEPMSSIAAWKMFFDVAGTESMRRMAVGRLLLQMLEQMEMKMTDKLRPDRKLFAYSVQEVNLVGLLVALGAWDGVVPPPSSCLLVELRENEDQQHVVTVSYKNHTEQPAHLLHIPGCRLITCTFPEFVAVVTPEMFNEQECYAQSKVERPINKPAVYQAPVRQHPADWQPYF